MSRRSSPGIGHGSSSPRSSPLRNLPRRLDTVGAEARLGWSRDRDTRSVERDTDRTARLPDAVLAGKLAHLEIPCRVITPLSASAD